MRKQLTNPPTPAGEKTPPPKIWRRLFHATAGSAIPAAGIFAPEPQFAIALTVLAIAALALDLGRIAIPPANRIYLRLMAPLLKTSETARITGATYMLIAAAPLFWLYGKDIAVPVMFFLSLGDPAAALIGQRMPGPRIRGKSPIGTAAFAAAGATAAAILIATGAIPHHWSLWPAAALAALTELAAIPPDDNLAIPLITGTAMWVMGTAAIPP